jgi:Flp pilus assembly protein protease CpaA
MDWEKIFKKYVWDEQKTPYLTRVSELTRTQASNELFVYALFLGIFFAVVAMVSLTGVGHPGRSPGVALYAFSIVCAAILLGATRHYYAAVYCTTAPPAALLYFYLFGFHPNLGAIDHAVIVFVVVIWLRYSFRVLAIGKGYEDMPLGPSGKA